MSIYEFSSKSIDGENISLETYKGKVVLIVNTASKCGFTSQYEGLEKLYSKYNSKGLEILGFPCNQFREQEPGSNSDVKSFCSLNYGVSFQMFEKVDVRDAAAHPLFKYLTSVKPFEGFDMSHPIGEILLNALKINFPSYLEGNSIKWNFTKFLVDKSGSLIGRYEPTTNPEALEKIIAQLL